jgi:FMN hydrolase / 5-amino-6-(5-phospho-D-ribitylamino)uracil phosphatase
MASVILWDVMDTLVRDPFFTHMPAFFGHSFDGLVERLRRGTWVEFELGRLDEAELYANFFADGTPIDGPGLKRCMRDAYAWIEGVEPLLAELKARGAEMHALSNYPHWYRLVDERLGLSRYLELSFISCETGLRKPWPEAYLRACAGLGRRPEECLFIDDREVNCQAARALGMPAWRFQGEPTELRRRLTAAGFL